MQESIYNEYVAAMAEIVDQERKEVYCSNCKVTPLPIGYIELCHGCVMDIVDWLAWDQYATQLNRQYELEDKAIEHSYQSQFTL